MAEAFTADLPCATVDVRIRSGAPLGPYLRDGGFTPESGHARRSQQVQPRANRRHTGLDIEKITSGRPGESICLFDHLIGAGKKAVRDADAESLRALEIDD